MQKTASEHATRQVSWQMGCSSNRVPFLSASGRKLRPQFTQAHVKREDLEKKALSGGTSRSFCCDFDGRATIWRKQRESLYPSCLVPIVQTAAGGLCDAVRIFSSRTLDS